MPEARCLCGFLHFICPYKKVDTVGVKIPGGPGLHAHRDPPLLLRGRHVHQHSRGHLRHPLLLAGIQSGGGLLRGQGPPAPGAAERHRRGLPGPPKAYDRRHLRPGHSGGGAGIPGCIRSSPDRDHRLSYLVQDFGNLCGRIADRRADLKGDCLQHMMRQ